MTEVSVNLESVGLTATASKFYFKPDVIRDEMMCMMQAKFATERQDPYVYNVPANWWEHLKQTYAPKWFLKQWPVQFTQHKVDIKVIYPYLKTKLPLDIQGPVAFVVINNIKFSSFMTDMNAMTPIEYRHQIAERLRSEVIRDSNRCPYCERLWLKI